MSNDDLQKAMDEITNGDNASDTVANNTTADAGAAPLSGSPAAESAPANTNLNFAETPDMTIGAAPANLFGTPPAPDTSSAMPAGTNEPTANPATEAAPAVEDAPLGADPLAGFNPEPVASATPAVEAAPAPAPAEPVMSTPIAETQTPIEDTSIPEIKTEEPVGHEEIAEEAMKELYPLLDKVPSMTEEEKFDVCIKVGDEALPNALKYAKGISDDTTKAEALLKIIEKAK